MWLQEAVRDKRIGLSKVHGPVNPADLMTKHRDHATQIRLLGVMEFKARLGRAETAPKTGEVDEPVCSIDSASEEEKECEYEKSDCDKKVIDRVLECMVDWVDEVITSPFGAGDNQIAYTENGETIPDKIVEISPCQIGSTENGVMSSRTTPIGVARREKATVLDPSLRRRKETKYAMHLL